jgi:hypothetical protein
MVARTGGEFAGLFQGLYAMEMFRVPWKKSKDTVWLAVFIISYWKKLRSRYRFVLYRFLAAG